MKEGLETFVYFIAAGGALAKLYYTGDSSLAVAFIIISLISKAAKSADKRKRRR